MKVGDRVKLKLVTPGTLDLFGEIVGFVPEEPGWVIVRIEPAHRGGTDYDCYLGNDGFSARYGMIYVSTLVWDKGALEVVNGD